MFQFESIYIYLYLYFIYSLGGTQISLSPSKVTNADVKLRHKPFLFIFFVALIPLFCGVCDIWPCSFINIFVIPSPPLRLHLLHTEQLAASLIKD